MELENLKTGLNHSAKWNYSETPTGESRKMQGIWLEDSTFTQIADQYIHLRKTGESSFCPSGKSWEDCCDVIGKSITPPGGGQRPDVVKDYRMKAGYYKWGTKLVIF